MSPTGKDVENISLPSCFLSEGDLSLGELTIDELIRYWNLWLEQAQATNDDDRDVYSHGVFAGLELLRDYAKN